MNVERQMKALTSRADADDDRSIAAAASALADRAAAEGLVDVAVATMDSPIGELTVAVTPRGLVTVAFEDEDREVVFERLARELSPRVMEAAAPTDEARRELEQYFRRDRRRFEVAVDRA